MLTLDLPPQIQNAVITQATAQGVTVNDYILHAITTALSESPKQKHIDDVMVFDNDTMKERLKGFENREQALKNGVVVPKSALADFESFQAWLAQRQALRATL